MRRDDWSEGSMTVELVVLTPVIILFVLVALAMGRFELAREQVVSAARAGAEAASVVSVAGDAQSTALSVVSPDISDQVHTCADLTVVTDTSHFIPGGSVSVTVSCQIGFTDLLIPGFPGHEVVQATVTAPIDPYRSLP
jgi:hypothetical protein